MLLACRLIEPVMSSRLCSSMAMRAASRSRSAARCGPALRCRRVSASESAALRRHLGDRLHGLAGVGERKLEPFAAGFGLAGEGDRDEREAAALPQPNSRQTGLLPKAFARYSGKSGSGGAISVAMGSLSERRITSLKTLAESGKAGFHCVSRQRKQDAGPRRPGCAANSAAP